MEYGRILLWDELDLEPVAKTGEPQPVSLPPVEVCQALPGTPRRLYLVRPVVGKGRLTGSIRFLN